LYPLITIVINLVEEDKKWRKLMNCINRHLRYLVLIMGVLFVGCLTASAVEDTDPFIGKFIGQMEGARYLLKIEKNTDDDYQGVIALENVVLPLKGKRNGKEITGEINDHGEIYPITITLSENGALYFEDDDGESIVFQPEKTIELGSKGREESASAKETRPEQNVTQRQVYVNRTKIDANKLNAFETMYQVRIEDGHYWYDHNSGAWGVEDGPTVGFIMAGLDFPRPMPPDISGGGTGIFINGREIHPLDQKGLQQLFGITYPGHYWLDNQGNLGIVNGPFLVNIVAAIQAAQRQQADGSTTHGYGSTYGGRGTLAGDGQGGHIYSGRTATGKSVFWYPGM
jgi:hypothetical protein